MAAHDDVLHFQMQDGVHNDGLGGEVGGREHVGDVAVHEDITGLETQNGGLGDAGVRAAEPENGWMLAGCEGGEEIGMVVGGCISPLSIFLESAGQAVGGCNMGTFLASGSRGYSDGGIGAWDGERIEKWNDFSCLHEGARA